MISAEEKTAGQSIISCGPATIIGQLHPVPTRAISGFRRPTSRVPPPFTPPRLRWHDKADRRTRTAAEEEHR
jgi:hypothetical protein